MALFRRDTKKSREEENRGFREKYEQFRELLERNTEVLETIGLLSEIRDQDRWISLGQLRSLMTRSAVNVYRLLQNLNSLTDYRYKILDKTFLELEKEISARLTVRPKTTTDAMAIPLEKAGLNMVNDLGAKAVNLGEAARLPGLNVPRGIGFTIEAYESFLDHNGLNNLINKELLLLASDDMPGLERLSQRLVELIMAAEFPPALDEALQDAYQSLGGGADQARPVVLRSSAVGEDEADSSFAGLYRSVLNPTPDEVGEAYKSVLAGTFSSRVMTYFAQKGLCHELCPMGVLMMEMIPAKASGVMFTKKPDSGGGNLIISAVWGLGQLAVEGSLEPDLYEVSREAGNRLISRITGHKPFKLELAPQGGTVRAPVEPKLQDAPCLSEEQISQLAGLGLMLEEHFKTPQDVEWCLDQDNVLHIVQCRPLREHRKKTDWRELYPWDAMENGPQPLVEGLQTGSSGVACGPVVSVKQANGLGGPPPGAVLAVGSTEPDLVNLLPRAAAILAERGNPTGHLAIIAREFDLPLLIGLPPDRMRELAELPEVTVDAFTGSLFPGRVEPLLEFASSLGRSESSGPPSVLRNVLEEVLELVTPLNLTNPRDRSFRPQAVRTIHDVIRFAHEKAVQAMFEINDGRLTQKGKVVHLKIGVPLDIYLIDMGGGLSEEVKKKKVSPKDITSIPMRALIEGMTTPGVRWAGHVPIDFKGFVSVFANTMFDGAKYERSLGDRSYAILSRHYVNFSSRLGYHFSIVDAFLGERQGDNYISFRFKGGAARLEMRARRAQFLKEILLRHDFWVDQKSDLLNARIRRLSMSESEEKLRMLGRLMGCARQLDVTMYNLEMVDHYVECFMNGDYAMGHGETGPGGGAS